MCVFHVDEADKGVKHRIIRKDERTWLGTMLLSRVFFLNNYTKSTKPYILLARVFRG